MKVHAIYIFIALLAGLLLCGCLGGTVKEGIDSTLDSTSDQSTTSNTAIEAENTAPGAGNFPDASAPVGSATPAFSSNLPVATATNTVYNPVTKSLENSVAGLSNTGVGAMDGISLAPFVPFSNSQSVPTALVRNMESSRANIPPPLPVSQETKQQMENNELLESQLVPGEKYYLITAI